MQGRIVKATAGFYYVQCDDNIISCRACGKFRKDEAHPLVGDNVEITLNPDGSGYVQKILPRKNFFIRPAVANVDALIMVASAVNPITDPFLIDRVTALAEAHSCEVLILLNKFDLNPAEKLKKIYSKTPYHVIQTSAETGEGIEELSLWMKGKLCAFTGNSGVGKSSLLNSLHPDACAKTGEVSEKLGRGKHTTRHVEVFELPFGGSVTDTPGFGSFDVDQMETIPEDQLESCFPDFADYIGNCRFMDCRHDKEPDCAVRAAVEHGDIAQSRYESYLRLLNEARKRREY